MLNALTTPLSPSHTHRHTHTQKKKTEKGYKGVTTDHSVIKSSPGPRQLDSPQRGLATAAVSPSSFSNGDFWQHLVEESWEGKKLYIEKSIPEALLHRLFYLII